MGSSPTPTTVFCIRKLYMRDFWVWRDARMRILDRDKCCVYCGDTSLTLRTASIDHLIPKAKGGTNDDSNLALSCKKCNTDKEDLLPLEFIMIKNGYWNRLKQGDTAKVVVCW